MRKSRFHPRSSTEAIIVVWVLLSAYFSLGASVLSLLGQLNRTGCALLLATGIVGSIFIYYRLNGRSWLPRGLRLRRFKRPFPALYLLCALGALVGGAIHAPSNQDAMSYRVPRLLHYLAEGQWHWIGGRDARMDFSGMGFETLMLPPLAALHTMRLAFLINAIPYLLLPGLIFLVFKSLGIRKSISATWMWILPCASCFVMEAGSIGNDFIACIYLLAALMFALKAGRSGSQFAVTLAIVSAALMTGAKASNLPLLLPVAICLVPAFLRFPKSFATAAITGIASVAISFVPIAVSNAVHTGDWTGQPATLLKIKNPIVGLAGNAIILSSAALAPAVFPPAESFNRWFNAKTNEPMLSWIKDGFAAFEMSNPQLAAEEHSGLGLGVTAALILGFAGGVRSFRLDRLRGIGVAVFIGFWLALLFFMMKLGNSGAARLVAPYYVGLVALPLLSMDSGKVFQKQWWKWSSMILLFPILPALACNPARPLLPMKTIVNGLVEKRIGGNVSKRMDTVYEVYANRSDSCLPVREMLPKDAKSIGFAGTSGESEYSFWLPLGTRRVTDLNNRPDGSLPDVSGYDAIVASSWGTQDRFGISVGELAKNLDWKIIGTTEVQPFASSGPLSWSVLVPKNGLPSGQ